MKHTPGPWKLRKRDDEHSFDWVEIAPKREITVEGRSFTEANANALLVSKAPEMYDMIQRYRLALEECATELDHYYTAEYPSDHPFHVRKRQHLHDTNIARVVLEETKDFLSDI